MRQFIFDTTGIIQTVKFEELGAYFEHPISAYTLSDYFDVEEIRNSTTIQDAIDNNYILAYDQNGNTITSISYLENTPIFDIDNFEKNKSYVGYGTTTACKIQLIETDISGSYVYTWSGGNESFDKIWANRASYSYF